MPNRARCFPSESPSDQERDYVTSTMRGRAHGGDLRLHVRRQAYFKKLLNVTFRRVGLPRIALLAAVFFEPTFLAMAGC
jgi:hypothetical protein